MWVVVLVFFTAVIQVLHFLVANASRCVLGPCKGRHRFFFSVFLSLSPREGGVEGAAPGSAAAGGPAGGGHTPLSARDPRRGHPLARPG